MKSSKISSQLNRFKHRQWNENYPKKFRPSTGFVVLDETGLSDDCVMPEDFTEQDAYIDYVSLDISEINDEFNIDSSGYTEEKYLDDENDLYELTIDSSSINEYDIDDTVSITKKPEQILLYDVNPNLPEPLTKKEKDSKIVTDFFKEQTHSNFARLWKRFYPNIRKYALKIMGDEARADDMAQETFQRAWEKRSYYTPSKSRFTTWLQNICKNLCLTTLKNDSKCAAIDCDLNDMCSNVIYTDILEYKYNEPNYYIVDDDTNMIKTFTFDDVMLKMYDISVSELKSINPLLADIIKMKDIENMTLKEIAENLSIPMTKVRSTYYDMRTKIRDIIIERHKEIYGEYQDALINRIESTYVPSFFKHSNEDETESNEDYQEAYG